MKNLLSLAFLWLAFSNFSQTSKVFHLYYDDIYGQKVGMFPVGANESTKDCFQFTYDKQGRLKSFTKIPFVTTEETAMNPITTRYIYEKDSIYIYRVEGFAQTESVMNDQKLLAMIKSDNYQLSYSKFVLANKIIQFRLDHNWTLYDIYGDDLPIDERVKNLVAYKFKYYSPSKIGRGEVYKEGASYQYSNWINEVFNIDNKNSIVTTKFIDYRNEWNEVSNEAGIYSIEQKRDALGGCIYIKAKNKDGLLVNYSSGEPESYYVRYALNKLGDVSASQNYDANDVKTIPLITYYDDYGQTAESEPSHFESHREYNNNHQVTAISYYDPEGKPMLDQTKGYHKITSEFNQEGLLTSQRYFDTSNKMMLIPSNDIDPINAGYIYEFDMNGNVVKSCYLNENNTPLERFGFACTASEKDYGNNNEILYLLDASNNPATDPSGAHRYEYITTYNEELYDSERIVLNVYDINGAFLGTEQEINEFQINDPEEHNPETIYERTLNDVNGKMISQRYFDRNHTPKSFNGYHARLIAYNPFEITTTYVGAEKYNIKKQIWTDETGLAASNNYGETATETETIKTNDITKITLKRFGLNGQLLQDSLQAAISTIAFSDVEDEYFSMYGFNSDGTPFLSENNEWRTTIEKGRFLTRNTKYSFYDTTKSLTQKELKKYIIEQTLTSPRSDHTIITRYFGKNGKPTVDSYDVHKIIVTMDSMNLNAIATAYFDKKGKPTMHLEKGYHKVSTLYDMDNNLLLISFFDVKNKPTSTNFPLEDNMQITAASVKYIYTIADDGISYLTKTLFYDAQGKLVLEY